MASIKCPYCDVEISMDAVEVEDGCCPECGAIIAGGSIFEDGFDDEDDFDDDFDDDDFDDDFDDDLLDIDSDDLDIDDEDDR